ncbi:MAG: TolC family protein [Candidatus Omnitrophota bacterium]
MSDKNLRIILFVFLSVFLFSFSAFSQDLASSTSNEFDLTSTILTAFKSNKDIQMQEQGVIVASANIEEARSIFFPHVNAELNYTHNDRVPVQDIFFGYRNSNLVGLSVNQSIYSGGANMATFRQSQLSLKAQQETLRAKKLDVEFDARRLYYGLLLAYETQRIAKEALSLGIAHYEDVRRMYEQGTASKFDMLQSGVQVSLLEPDVVKAANEIDSIKAELNKLLARKVDALIQTKEQLAYNFIEINENEFLQKAYLERPEIKLKSLGVDIDQWGIAMAKSGYRPQVDLAGNLAYTSNNLKTLFKDQQRNWSAGIAVNIPIFEGFSTKAKVDAAKAQYAQAKISKDNLVDQVAVDIRKACLDLKQAEAIIRSQRDNVGQAKEALRIAEVSYANGVAINLDVFDAQVSLAQIQKNLAAGIYDYLMAQAYLDRSIGESYLKETKK